MSQSHITVKQLIARMQNEESFPAISQNIIELNSKAAPTSKSSANELAALILRDYSLTTRLLKVANSAMYGQFAGTITTISRAVVILGFEQVQSTSAGLIFFEHLQDRSKSHYIKEAVLSAFLSGILARELSKIMGLGGWENFYIGAMFHNLGSLMIMCYFQQEFKMYQQLVDEDLDSEIAARRVFGISFADMGIGVARSWGLPKEILDSMKLPHVGELEKYGNEVNHHQLLPRFANELCDIGMNVLPKERHGHLLKLLKKYRKPYPIPRVEIVNMMDAAIKEMQKLADVLRFDHKDLKQLEQRSFNATEKAPAVSEKQTATETLRKFEINEPDQSTQRLTTAEERKQHLQGGIQEITNVMLDDFTLDEVLSMILETIYRGIGFNRLVIFFKDPRSDKMQARYGLGPNTAEIVENFSFNIDGNAEDLFNMALSGNKDLYIGNISDIEIRELKPVWFTGTVFSPSLAIYPIIINKKTIGLIYGGHNEAGEHLDREQLNVMKTLRNQAALAIKQCFAGS